MINSVYEPDIYTSNGVEDTYDINFEYMSLSTNIKVSVTVSGELTELETTDYTVDTSADTVTLDSVPTNGESIVIELNPDFLQETDFIEGSAITANSLESTLDILTLQSQVIKERMDRSIALDILAGVDADTLGTMSTQDSDDVTITGGTISGLDTPLALTSGGTGATTASAARTNLGLGSMAVQNSNSVTVTGGTVAGSTLDINGLTADASPDGANDYTITYDASAGSNKKVLLDNLVDAVADLESDTTPVLGGNLAVNTNSIIFPSATIDNVSASTTLASASDTTLATSLATKTYIDNKARKIILPLGGSFSNLTAGNTKIFGFFGDTDTYAEAVLGFQIPVSGTLRNMRVASYLAPSSGETYTVTLRQNGSDTALTTTISGTAQLATDLTHTVSVSAGDYITIKCVASASATTIAALVVTAELQ